MRWRKLGLIYTHPTGKSSCFTGAMIPTPVLIDADTIRLFYSASDAEGRARPFFIDVSAGDPAHIVTPATPPLLELGRPGTFDDNGILCCSVVRTGEQWYMYYAGFELYKNVRYKLFTGLAISRDGLAFSKHANTPILDRSNTEFCFRCGPFVYNDEQKFILWYVGGSEWLELAGGKQMPIYEVRYAESEDGIHWPKEGRLIIPIEKEDEHGFGRPWVRKNGDKYEMFYSIRRKSLMAYRLGYAVSHDGIAWERRDEELNLDVTPGTFDGEAIMYSAVLTVGDKTYCFYNGNGFGKDGIALAIREN